MEDIVAKTPFGVQFTLTSLQRVPLDSASRAVQVSKKAVRGEEREKKGTSDFLSSTVFGLIY